MILPRLESYNSDEDQIKKVKDLIYELDQLGELGKSDMAFLLTNLSKKELPYLYELARHKLDVIYKNTAYIIPKIVLSNYCVKECSFCNFRRSNKSHPRYRLSKDELISAVTEIYKNGHKTILLESGNDAFFTAETISFLITEVSNLFRDIQFNLSINTLDSRELKMINKYNVKRFNIFTNTVSPSLYYTMHEITDSLEDKIKFLKTIKSQELELEVGVGIFVNSPLQTPTSFINEFRLISQLKPEVIDIVPFISDDTNTTVEQTCALIAIVRLLSPLSIITANEALLTLAHDGYRSALLSGANLIHIEYNSLTHRKMNNYFNNKHIDESELSFQLQLIKNILDESGYMYYIDNDIHYSKKGN